MRTGTDKVLLKNILCGSCVFMLPCDYGLR